MIFLDSAATSLRKPPAVARAMARAVRGLSSPGRGGYASARAAARTAFACREAAARLFRVPSPEQVVFTSSATHALNIAIHALVKPGSRVVISGFEHNAVTRPLYAIPEVEVRVARAPLFQPRAQREAFCRLLEEKPDAAVCTHVSNVFGSVLPVEEIAEECRARGVPLILDVSQSAGALPLDFSALGADFLAMPGHKGLCGPQGTGLLLCGRVPEPLLRGGTGSASRSRAMPDFLPDRLEAGTHNMPGIAGLLEGIRFLESEGVETVRRREEELLARLAAGLRALPGVEVFAAEEPGRQSGALSFRVAGLDCEELGEALGERDVAVRAGLHCAPLAHETAGTLESGTVRVSVGALTRPWEVEGFLEILKELLP